MSGRRTVDQQQTLKCPYCGLQFGQTTKWKYLNHIRFYHQAILALFDNNPQRNPMVSSE